MKNLLFTLILILLIQCSSVNLIQQPLTERDKKDKEQTLDESKLKITNQKVLIRARADVADLSDYKTILNSMTIEMADNLGGVEVVERRDFLVLAKERKLIDQTKFQNFATNQKLGIETLLPEAEFDKLMKDLQFYDISASLTGANMTSTYHPSQAIVDKKTGKTTYTEPYWSIDVKAGVNFVVEDPNGQQIFSKILTGSYRKSVGQEPKPEIIHLLLPKALGYCFEEIKPELQALFPMKSFVVATRGDKKYALVLGGALHKIRKGRVFDLVQPKNTEKPATIKIFQVGQEESWGEVSGTVEDVKIGTEIVIRPQPLNILDKIWRFIESNFGL
jgi:hypothetical protein